MKITGMHVRRWWLVSIGFCMSFLLGVAACSPAVPPPATRPSPTCAPAGSPAGDLVPPGIASVQPLGTLSRPATVLTRDGGSTALIGGRLLWFFGDTLLKQPAADGASYRSNTAAWSPTGSPAALQEPLDAHSAPSQFIPFTTDEEAYNLSKHDPNDRVAIWPGSLVTTQDGAGLVFYVKLMVKGYLKYDLLGTGLARLADGQDAATRAPGLLFNAPEPAFSEAFVDGDLLYLYGTSLTPGTNGQMAVACVPLAQADSRPAYRFWNGQAWVVDVSQSTSVFSGIPGSLSVSFNPYLGKYLSVHSQALSNRVVFQVAGAPQGPWSPPVALLTGEIPASGTVDYAGREHPELASGSGRTIVVSYYQPLGGFKGELRLVSVTFK
jgi:hypothetical protein